MLGWEAQVIGHMPLDSVFKQSHENIPFVYSEKSV